MKQYNRLFAAVMFFVSFIFFGCETEDDEFIDPVVKFLGKWKCEETSKIYGSGYNYDVSIARNPDNSSEIIVSNFYMQGINEKAVALVTGNLMTIYEQTICDDSIIIQGSGRYNNGEINLTYTANDGADLDNVTAIYYKD